MSATSSPSGPRPLGRRQFLTGAAASGLALGLAGAAADTLSARAPAASAAAFGYTDSGGYYTVTTGGGLVFRIHQATGGMTSLNINGTELQPSGTNESHVESGLPSPTVSAQQTGNYIIITASSSTWYGSGLLRHYYVAVNGQNNVYMATYAGSAGELRWIQYLNRSILTGINTPSDVSGGTAIESSDIDPGRARLRGRRGLRRDRRGQYHGGLGERHRAVLVHSGVHG